MSHRNLFLARLSAAQLSALDGDLRPTRLVTGEVLHEAGEKVQSVYFPNNGVVSVVTVMKDGRAVESATLGFESVVGVVSALTGAASHARVFVQIAGGALKMDAARLRAFVDNDPKVLRSLLLHVQNDIAQAEQTSACNALHLSKHRLARWLLLTDDRVDGAVVNLTQDYLAVMLGVQRTTVSTLASELKAEGLIDYQRGRIEIVDRARLEMLSCECYEVGRMRHADI
ncbi:MAG: Crp/Fnr family transcriptional regulator [Phenylobacterium sp.]|uniref:Crp/Fnr family transcriptional regulator n=1 Tax=Phenylobacterium sp. TaxID=1871053 RepID=UPI00273383DA|nr:Crp/Fnr family transcriptional regulator [Phenylobacterium sp.]MDP3175540.1 Crp/Fnr family transcriptional regulator [Phenylobacterium sp.]